MEKLPPELLFKIMMFLPPMDRLSCALTCRRLAEAMTSAQLLDDVWLDIAGHEIKAAQSVLVHTQRQYTRLSLCQANLSQFDPDFWGKIGASLRVLELQYCSWFNHTFYTVLRQCTKLESLKIVHGDYKKIDDFAPPEGACHEELRDSLSRLRHLHLDTSRTAEVLDLLLRVMPNVTSVYFRPKSDDFDSMERLPSILKEKGIICTGADFCRLKLSNSLDLEELIKFVEITSASLEDLRVHEEGLTESACDALVECTRLRRFWLGEVPGSFHGDHLKKLVLNSPDLEILKLHSIETTEDEGMEHLFELKKLHTLSLERSFTYGETTEFLCRLGELSTLVTLQLEYFNVNSRVIRSLGCLQNLRSLTLDECLDAECFEAICDNLDRLTELHLGNVSELTDADGMKLCRFKELRELSFSDGRGFSDVTFERGVGSRAMKYLKIGNCRLTDAGLMSIASHHDRLEKLELYDCKNITDAGVLAMRQNEPRLRELALTRSASLQGEWRTALRYLRRQLCVLGCRVL